MVTLLMVEDSPLLGSIASSRLQQEMEIALVWVTTYAEAEEVVKEGGQRFDYAIVDLNLPDVSGMKIVDLMIDQHITPIVFTSDCSDDTRDQLWQRNVADYVLKEGSHNVDYLAYIIKRLEANKGVGVLLVDDSAVYRAQFSRRLRTQNLTVIECETGAVALEALKANKHVKIVLTDYHMEGMDGFELVKAIRRSHRKDEIAIIGMSYRGDDLLAARFLKTGANDFLDKSCTTEQLFCRVNQNIDTVEMLQELREASVRDHLTGLYNRRYFYESGEKLLESVQRRKQAVAVAAVDIDHFKSVNDRYGHAAGDDVIRFVASQLKRRFRKSDIVARLGGEEFGILATDVDTSAMTKIMDDVRAQIGKSPLCVDRQEIYITVSIGLAVEKHGKLAAILEAADDRLYRAKNEGRDRVVDW